jgi:hypothetical protein
LRQMCWGTVDRIGFELLKSWRFVWNNSGSWAYICRRFGKGPGGRCRLGRAVTRNMNTEVNDFRNNFQIYAFYFNNSEQSLNSPRRRYVPLEEFLVRTPRHIGSSTWQGVPCLVRDPKFQSCSWSRLLEVPTFATIF